MGGIDLTGYGYSVALFLHLLFLLAATVATALAGYAALGLRRAASPMEAARWGGMVERVVPAFPVAALGLFGSGAYMTQDSWSWSTPWVVGGITGLAVIMLLGAGVEGRRGRELKRELMTAGMSDRAQRLLRDPIAWSAKVATWTLLVGVVFVMTTKPGSAGCAVALAVAFVAGPLGAVPFWRTPAPRAAGVTAPLSR